MIGRWAVATGFFTMALKKSLQRRWYGPIGREGQFESSSSASAREGTRPYAMRESRRAVALADVRGRLLSAIDQTHALISTLLVPGGARAVVAWRPRSLSALRLVRGVDAAGFDPDTVIDVGANVGQFSRAVLGRWPSVRIVAFEPQPMLSERLGTVLSGDDGHVVHPIALGDHDGQIEFHPHRYNLSSSVLRTTPSAQRRFDWAAELPTVEIPIRRLSTVLPREELQGTVLLKLDVQGYERAVLRGAEGILSAVDAVIVEQSFDAFYVDQSRPEEIDDILSQAGFYLDRVLDVRREDTVIVEADLLYRRDERFG